LSPFAPTFVHGQFQIKRPLWSKACNSKKKEKKEGRRKKAAYKAFAFNMLHKTVGARHQWVMPVILATQKVETRRIVDRSQLRQANSS
jgi:hypothetical protein